MVRHVGIQEPDETKLFPPRREDEIQGWRPIECHSEKMPPLGLCLGMFLCMIYCRRVFGRQLRECIEAPKTA